jgi:hypothetical protein
MAEEPAQSLSETIHSYRTKAIHYAQNSIYEHFLRRILRRHKNLIPTIFKALPASRGNRLDAKQTTPALIEVDPLDLNYQIEKIISQDHHTKQILLQELDPNLFWLAQNFIRIYTHHLDTRIRDIDTLAELNQLSVETSSVLINAIENLDHNLHLARRQTGIAESAEIPLNQVQAVYQTALINSVPNIPEYQPLRQQIQASFINFQPSAKLDSWLEISNTQKLAATVVQKMSFSNNISLLKKTTPPIQKQITLSSIPSEQGAKAINIVGEIPFFGRETIKNFIIARGVENAFKNKISEFANLTEQKRFQRQQEDQQKQQAQLDYAQKLGEEADKQQENFLAHLAEGPKNQISISKTIKKKAGIQVRDVAISYFTGITIPSTGVILNGFSTLPADTLTAAANGAIYTIAQISQTSVQVLTSLLS